MLATIVDWETLGEVALASLVAVVGVTLAFSLAIVGATRMVDMRRDGRGIEAGAYAAADDHRAGRVRRRRRVRRRSS